MNETVYIGQPIDRVDGPVKVTGKARYAAEILTPGLAYGCVVSSTICRGRIRSIDTGEALKVTGVLKIFTHENRPQMAWFDRNYQDDSAPDGSPFRPLAQNKVMFHGQPIALVVAECLEVARYAASLVHADYETEAHITQLEVHKDRAHEKRKLSDALLPKQRGMAGKALIGSKFQVNVTYTTPIEHHNPLELHASTVVWENDDKLTIHDKTQGVLNCQNYIAHVFHLPTKKVRVLSPYVGGAFGSGLRPQYQLFLAVMAALDLKRSVRVELTRQQMFTLGHRPTTMQNLALGADAEGQLQSVIHEVLSETSCFEDYREDITSWSGILYQCPNVKLNHKIAPIDLNTPMDMRAPGAATGIFALESALDELAYVTGQDPLDLRLKNYAERDQNFHRQFSSKALRECYEQGAERFGWHGRTRIPRSMKVGHELIGWGMATGCWEALQNKASAKAVLTSAGKLVVSSATSDMGTGTYTIMTQIAADAFGLDIKDIEFKLGDSSLPSAPVAGGSWTAASVGSAVYSVCQKLRKNLYETARKLRSSPFYCVALDKVTIADGCLHLKSDPQQMMSISALMRMARLDEITADTTSIPNLPKQLTYLRASHSAVFVEVKVDEDFGRVSVNRVVSAIAGGRILNPKTARSQIIGSVVWGIGMALQEESVLDHRMGRFVNNDFAGYHIPVNADIRDIEVIFVDEEDKAVNPLGVKGLGEVGLVGVPAAIGNAVFHATGKRIRELPITLDKVL